MTILVGMTTEFGVVGSPIKHSLSPVIHSAAYLSLGFDFSYQKHEVSQGELAMFLNKSSLSGVSVTMPLKYEAYQFAASFDDYAARTGVVNTLVRGIGGWIGHNTDVSGFIECLKQVPEAGKITVLGSGATARSAALAISKVFPGADVLVVGRSAQSVDEVIDLLSGAGVKAAAASISPASVLSSDLIISTVPGSALEELWNEVANNATTTTGTLFDVVYSPWPSTASRSWGPRSISGLELLIWQAIGQVRIFAEASGDSISVADDELYKIMKAAIQEQSELK